MKIIGGFYEMLLPKESFEYHDKAVALSNGRACIRQIIKSLNIKKCYLPNYTCDAIYHPFDLENIDYELYCIDEKMEALSLPELIENEFFYYINYFGVKNNVVKKLYNKYGNKLIIDNTHDFFKQQQYDCCSFTSARKYFGVPDGAFLYSSVPINNNYKRFDSYTLSHNLERIKGNQVIGFKMFQDYEKSLTCEINKISIISEKLLSSIDIDNTKLRRKNNFKILHEILGKLNLFIFEDMEEEDIPFAYPFLPADLFDKSLLYSSNIFVPTLWADALDREITTEFETKLSKNLLPLPIDERYDDEDMLFMSAQIIKFLNHV